MIKLKQIDLSIVDRDNDWMNKRNKGHYSDPVEIEFVLSSDKLYLLKSNGSIYMKGVEIRWHGYTFSPKRGVWREVTSKNVEEMYEVVVDKEKEEISSEIIVL